ncbi:hypothetical protein ACFL20_07740, partial [Spirochaetota bacterium]
GAYAGLNPDDVIVTNIDNDTAGITVSAISGPTTEGGGTATFTIVLETEPMADVTIGLSSDNTNEGTVSPGSLTFTSGNWNVAQTVTVTGVDDDVVDLNKLYNIVTAAATSTDTAYSGFNAADMTVTNTDDDTAGITVSAISGDTTEIGGNATFTIVLDSEPTADVTIGLTSDNTNEGTVSPGSLTFTSGNWNVAQTVTVAGADDSIDDGDIAYNIVTAAATSTDTAYSGFNAGDMSVTNTDDDAAGITLGAISGPTTEIGGTATFTIVLDSEPTADVTIGLSSDNTNEGTVSPASLTFTSGNWNTAQTVTITGVDDSLDDGDQVFNIVTALATSADTNYNNMNASDMPVTNTDDDTAGVTLSGISGPTTEVGGTATFTIVLDSEPTGDVTIGLSSDNTNEGTVSPASLTFTSGNWNTAQTVTVTGVNDTIDDGDIAYNIVTAAATSTDTTYSGFNASDMSVTNTDDDTAGITLGIISGPTTEVGGTATFTIVLNSEPTDDVTIGVSSSDTGEGTVSPVSLTFTSVNWNAPQTVTVTGVDDFVQDGDQVYTIVTAAATSLDTGYDTMNAGDMSVTNTDNDSAGVTVTPISGDTTEAGGTATFTIVLNSEPTDDVTIGVSSSDTGEGTVLPVSITFTSGNWNAPQTITVTGANDFFNDGDQSYTILTAAATSLDADYNGVDPGDVSVTNIDNDSAGVTVSPISGDTAEAGVQATFTIVLNSEPSDDVTIGISSSDVGEGTVSAASVTFTSGNWNAPQTITVTGVNDDVQDGNQPYTIITAAATSLDSDYNGFDPGDVSVTNTDNDTAGVTVSLISGDTTEAGIQATFTIVLNSEPTDDVTIGISSSDVGEGTVSVASVTFTSGNWNAPQTITVTGIDDAVQDGNQVFSIITAAATSLDTNYDGFNAGDVSVTNTDNDSAGVTVSAISGDTTEAGVQATFTVVLNSEPTDDVTIGVSSSDTTEGTVSPASVTFTSGNWNAPQTITVTGVNDDIQDGNQVFNVVTAAATSFDANYNGYDAGDVAVTNTDNDSAGVTVSAISGDTTEVGGTATFTVVLNSEPTDDVVIDLTSSDAGEGTVSPISVTFTSANWNAPQTVTVTGVDDAIVDGNQIYSIVTDPAVSADTNYNNLDAGDVSVTNTDDDTPGITVSAISGDTTEGNGTATFTVVLTTLPSADVTIGFSSSDTGEGTVSPASVTFTTVNWNAPQTVTVTGVDDAIIDGNQVYSIITAAATSSDTNYNGLDASDVSVTNTDNDSAAGITVSAISGDTTEGNATATFTVVLNSAPTADVTIGISSSDTGEGTVSTSSMTFTSANWSSPQTVTVTGVDDAVVDGNQPYFILTAAATSSDTDYNGLDASNVSVTNLDNDSAGITVGTVSGNTIESGTTATFTIVLNSPPTADVTIGLTSSDTGEGTVSPASVTFTSGNWNAPQTVTITGVNDVLLDGDQPYTIITGSASSADTNYNGLDPVNVSLNNIDDDSPGITVSSVSGDTTEGGGTAIFTIVLNAPPTADVTIGISSTDTSEGTVSASSITFTSGNWNTPQTITITGVDDLFLDGNQPYTIITGAATSSDTNYNGLNPVDIYLNTIDDDSPGFTVTPTSGLITSESGSEATFTVVLNSAPTDDVTITMSSSDTSEGTINPGSITFTTVNWSAPQIITVTGVDDALQDGNQLYTVILNAATSSDTNYDGLNPIDVSVSNYDDETPGFTLEPISSALSRLVTSEMGGQITFTVVLNSAPTADVTLPITSSDTSEATVSVSSLIFTALNWNSPQTVTITGVDDALVDGSIDYTITTGTATSTDTNYNGINPADVFMTNIDDESAGVTISPDNSIQAPLFTTERGDTAVYTMVLNSPPNADVIITLSSNDATEGSVSPGFLLFTTDNWNSPQTVTVTGVDDALTDGDKNYRVQSSVSSTDTNYNNLNVADVFVTNMDEETPGFLILPFTTPQMRLLTTESSGQAYFTVVLMKQPTDDVTLTFSSSDTGEAIIDTNTIVFTVDNWDAPQIATITGVDDALQDGNQNFKINFDKSSSNDSDYDKKTLSAINCNNQDND